MVLAAIRQKLRQDLIAFPESSVASDHTSEARRQIQSSILRRSQRPFANWITQVNIGTFFDPAAVQTRLATPCLTTVPPSQVPCTGIVRWTPTESDEIKQPLCICSGSGSGKIVSHLNNSVGQVRERGLSVVLVRPEVAVPGKVSIAFNCVAVRAAEQKNSSTLAPSQADVSWERTCSI